MNSYSEAVEFLDGGRSKTSRPIENNTRVERRGADVAIKLHDTDVVTYHEDGSVTLNSGGWLTVTTKDRINRYLGQRKLRVWSDRGRWFIYRFGDGEMTKGERFFDGITIAADGTVLNPLPVAKEERQRAAEEAMAKRITKYIDGYIKALEKGIPVPNNGDCWFCLFVVVEGPDEGKTWGDIRPDDNEHLLSHMADRYYVPSLLINAMKERKYGDWKFVLAIRANYDLLKEGTMKLTDPRMRTEIRRDLRKYLRKRLLTTVAQ